MPSAKHCEVVLYPEDLLKGELLHFNSDISKLLSERPCDYAYILHDKDVKIDGTAKKPHYHVYLHFKGNSRDFSEIARWFGIAAQQVCYVKSGTRKKSILLYLTHKNATEKYQYPDDSIVSNFDVAAAINKDVEYDRLEEILLLIDNGVIKPYNVHEYMSIIEYNRYKKKIDIAFEYVRKRAAASPERDLTVMYVSGKTGSGKTTWAKHYSLMTYGQPAFVSSSSNDFLQGYGGQSVIILDDFRDSWLSFSEFLKLIDNHTNSTVKSRFYNKDLSECKCLIITSVIPLFEMYSYVNKECSEDIAQAYRRINYLVEVKKDLVYLFLVDNLKDNKIEFVCNFKNPASDKKSESLSVEDKLRKNFEKMIESDIICVDGPRKVSYNDIVSSDDWKPLDSKEIEYIFNQEVIP